MANKRYLREKKYSLFEQMIAVRAIYPDSNCEIHNNVLRWNGKIRPTPCSREYTVNIQYPLKRTPQVWVEGEELQNLTDKNFPHRYEIDTDNRRVRICLYRYKEFSSSKLLAKTIIPWAVEWLYFYEIWLATGEWYGGGQHPMAGEIKEERRKGNGTCSK